MKNNLEEAARNYANMNLTDPIRVFPAIAREAYCGFKDGASYQLENSVSQEHYDELKLNYERLNERERELQKQVNDLLETLEYILANSMDIHVVEQQAKAALLKKK